jgi:hypothetical protein
MVSTTSSIFPRESLPPHLLQARKSVELPYQRDFSRNQELQEHNCEHNCNNDSNNVVTASDTFKIPAPNAEDIYNNRRDIIQTALERAFQGISTIKNPTNTRGEIVRMDSIKELIKETQLTTQRNREDRISNSDNDGSQQAKQALSITYLLSSRLQRWTKKEQELRQQIITTTIAKVANFSLSAHLTIQKR